MATEPPEPGRTATNYRQVVDKPETCGQRLRRGHEISHHSHVLMFQVVTVKDETTSIVGETNQNLSGLRREQIQGVLPPLIVRTRPLPVTSQDLKLIQMQMNGVMQISDKMPDLGLPELRVSQRMRRIIGLAVDPPANA